MINLQEEIARLEKKVEDLENSHGIINKMVSDSLKERDNVLKELEVTKSQLIGLKTGLVPGMILKTKKGTNFPGAEYQIIKVEMDDIEGVLLACQKMNNIGLTPQGTIVRVKKDDNFKDRFDILV